MRRDDKSMEWIQSIQVIEDDKIKKQSIIYELASECRICGLLKYKNIACAPIATSDLAPELYPFILKIELPLFENDASLDKPNKKGYGFKYGIIGELLSIFSIWLRSRFYLISTTYGELTDSVIPLRENNKFVYIKPNRNIHKELFSSNGKNFTNLTQCLDLVKSLDKKYHEQFILACHNYSRAIREIGIDHEMVFVRLVSAIESLSSKFVELDKKEDVLKNKDIAGKINRLNLSAEELQALKNIFQNRNTQKKFIKFFKLYSKGYFKGGNYKAKRLKIKKSDLPQYLKTIYKARSKYLHNGESMYLSREVHGYDKWDTDSSVGEYRGNKYIPGSEKLPYIRFFEGLVRHCILNFLKQNSKKK